MSYRATLEKLYALRTRGVRPGLTQVTRYLAAHDNPQHAVAALHIAGTNGKGSTSAMLSSVLERAGYRVGLYTSPHLLRFAERIQINNQPLADDELAERIERCLAFCHAHDIPLTFFEVCTVIAYEAFRDHACDISVIEVGLGGRFDATNVITPKVSIITSIDLDHVHVLGSDLKSIAKEKAGIIKPGVPIICGEKKPQALEVIEAIAAERAAPCLLLERDFALFDDHADLALKGAHQRRNASCARAAIRALSSQGFLIEESALNEGLKNVRWPGRFEVCAGSPTWIFDAAHNAAGVQMLIAELKKIERPARRVMIFSAMKDKDVDEMLSELSPLVDKTVIVALNNERAINAERVAAQHSVSWAPNTQTAITLARENLGPNDQIVVCGSIFLLSEVYAQALGRPTDPPLLM